jgi:putative sporulation protein YtaF
MMPAQTVEKRFCQTTKSFFYDPICLLENGMETKGIRKQFQIWVIQSKKLGLVIQVLRKPSLADIDKSGTISAKEAMIIGFALSMDAFGAGVSTSFMGFSLLITATLVGLMNILFIRLGLMIGQNFSRTKVIKKVTFLPGAILICLGVLKMLS